MNSTGLQQNLIWLMENKTNEANKDPNRRLCCEKCRFSTKDVELFERHVAHHEQVTFSCTLCNHVSYSRVESQRHIVKHKGSYPYKCNWCSYGAVRRDYMVKHIQRIHGKPANGSFTTDCSLSAAKMEHLHPQPATDLCPDTARTLGEPVQNVKFVSHTAGNVLSLLQSGTQPRANAPYFVVGPVHQATSTQNHLICGTTPQSVTSTACVLPGTKTVSAPHSVAGTSHAVNRVMQGTSNPLNLTMNEADHRLFGKTFLGKATSSGALPRVHVTVPADRAIQQKTLLQGQMGATTEKAVIQSKTVGDSQVVYVSRDRTAQPKTLHHSQVGVTTEKTVIQSKTVADSQVVYVSTDRTALPKTLLQSQVGATTEKTVIQSKTVADSQVVYVSTDRTALPKTLLQSQVGANTEKTVIQSKTVADSQVVYVPADRTTHPKTLLQSQVGATTEITQSKALSKNQIALAVGNNTHLKTLLGNPAESFGPRAAEARTVPAALPAQRSIHTGVIRNVQVAQVGQRSVPSGAHLSIPVEHFGQGHGTPNAEKVSRKRTRPNILVRRPVEKVKPSTQSSVQVELLAPLNQPIEHNRPLTVSCPEEITIPAGCLVELVEVKNVNGARELELRLVPQQPSGPQPGSSNWSTAAASMASRLSFKCKASTDNNRPRLDSGTNSLQTNDQQVKALHLKQHSTDGTVDVKDEPEVTEQVLCSRMSVTEIHGSSSGGYYGVLKSVARPSESNKVMCQASTGLAQVTTPSRRIYCRGGTVSQSAKNGNITVKGLKCEISSNKHENAKSSYRGLPVISSVFSLCPSPEATLTSIPTRVEIPDEPVAKAQASSDSGNEGLTKVDDSKLCNLKTEEEAALLNENVQKSGQELKEKDSLLEDTKVKVPHSVESEKTDSAPESSQMFPKDLKDKIMPGMCTSSTDVLQTATADNPSPEKNVSSLSITHTVPNTEMEATNSGMENLLPEQRENPLASSMNPTVALARIPSLDFYSLLECAKKVSERPAGEESVTARPVLCCHSNQQNMQERAIKLVLKRRRSETENKDSGLDTQPLLACFDVLPPHKKHRKEKRKDKKHKSSKVVLDLRQILVKGKTEKLWLTPLKEDQLVKVPAPNQPVVVLNHPNPLFQMVSVGVGVQNLQDCNLISSAQSPSTLNGDTSAEIAKQCPSFKMKLKKVQGQEYQVTELVLKGVSEKLVH